MGADNRLISINKGMPIEESPDDEDYPEEPEPQELSRPDGSHCRAADEVQLWIQHKPIESRTKSRLRFNTFKTRYSGAN